MMAIVHAEAMRRAGDDDDKSVDEKRSMEPPMRVKVELVQSD